MRKRCKRKVWALIDPIRHAIDGVRVTSTAKLDQVRMLELSSIEAFSPRGTQRSKIGAASIACYP